METAGILIVLFMLTHRSSGQDVVFKAAANCSYGILLANHKTVHATVCSIVCARNPSCAGFAISASSDPNNEGSSHCSLLTEVYITNDTGASNGNISSGNDTIIYGSVANPIYAKLSDPSDTTSTSTTTPQVTTTSSIETTTDTNTISETTTALKVLGTTSVTTQSTTTIPTTPVPAVRFYATYFSSQIVCPDGSVVTDFGIDSKGNVVIGICTYIANPIIGPYSPNSIEMDFTKKCSDSFMLTSSLRYQIFKGYYKLCSAFPNGWTVDSTNLREISAFEPCKTPLPVDSGTATTSPKAWFCCAKQGDSDTWMLNNFWGGGGKCAKVYKV